MQLKETRTNFWKYAEDWCWSFQRGLQAGEDQGAAYFPGQFFNMAAAPCVVVKETFIPRCLAP
jgi:hypothetical protein